MRNGQREKVVCNVVSTKASLTLLGSLENGLALRICILFWQRGPGLYNLGLACHWMWITLSLPGWVAWPWARQLSSAEGRFWRGLITVTVVLLEAGVRAVIPGSLKEDLKGAALHSPQTLWSVNWMKQKWHKGIFDYIILSPHPIFQSPVLLKDRHFCCLFVCF